MTILSQYIDCQPFFKIYTKEVLMEKRQQRPVYIHFNSKQEAVNLYIQIEFRHFLEKLLLTQYNWLMPVTQASLANDLYSASITHKFLYFLSDLGIESAKPAAAHAWMMYVGLLTVSG